MNWYHRIITMAEKPAIVTSIMEWIRDNGCPNLDCTIFEDCISSGYMVSLVSENEIEAILEKAEWTEYEGMKGYLTQYGWVLFINGNYYWASRNN